MCHKLSRIERLDWAAQATVTARFFSWCGAFLIWYPFLRMWVWKGSYRWEYAPGVPEAWTWTAIACVAIVPTVMLWLRHRYAILAISLADFLVGTSLALLKWPNYNTPFDWVGYKAFSLLWICFGLIFFKRGIRIAAVYTSGWEVERYQVKQWLLVLQRNGKNDNVVEIRGGTFLRGPCSYRILNAHTCWVMATFRTGKEDELPIDYRVREPGAITLLEERDGPAKAFVDGRVINNIQNYGKT